MAVLSILALLIYTFGAYVYGAIVWLSLREPVGRGWAGQRRESPTSAEVVGLAMMVMGFVWFVVNLTDLVIQMGPRPHDSWVRAVLLWLAFLWPPLIMHVTISEVGAGSCDNRDALKNWRRAVLIAYPIALFVPLWATLVFLRVVPAPSRTLDLVLNLALTGLFVTASLYSVGVTRRFGRQGLTPRERLGDRAMTVMFLVTVALFVLMPTIAVAMQANLGLVVGRSIEIAVRSLPLAFLFVGAYFESRFDFFDVLVKRGAMLLVTFAALVLAFAALPLLDRFDGRPTTPWVYAVVFLPIALVLPLVHGKISDALDRWWLGRRFSVVDAVTHFISTLRSATTDAQLVTLAEHALGEIFGAQAWVRIGEASAPPDVTPLQQVRIAGASVQGTIFMGPRRSEAPYFSGDIALLGSLADVLASMLDNVHLQARKQEQEQRAQELVLHASRSELKALRAQINPHFLFNALNAIAGLIHRSPDRADRTIEQLADVFRYALRGAESEWALLADETEFVRSYLEVERARFGERLQVDIDVAPDVRNARVPTMMVQTLVENAVKHGVAEVIGPALIGVRATREGDRVRIAVTDNGEGFSERARLRTTEKRSGGYGLANIRQRLSGYFGDAAALTIDRDQARGVTIVAVVLPWRAS